MAESPMPIGTCDKLWHLTSQCLDSEANHTTVASVCAHGTAGTLVCAHDSVGTLVYAHDQCGTLVCAHDAVWYKRRR